jgi:hypothetical protein
MGRPQTHRRLPTWGGRLIRVQPSRSAPWWWLSGTAAAPGRASSGGLDGRGGRRGNRSRGIQRPASARLLARPLPHGGLSDVA